MRMLRTAFLTILALLSTAAFAQADSLAASCPIEAACAEPGGGGEPDEIELDTETTNFAKGCMQICGEIFGDVFFFDGAAYGLRSCGSVTFSSHRYIACFYRRIF